MTNRRFKRLISEVMAVAVILTSLQGVFCEDVTTEKTYEDKIYIEEAFEEEEVNACGEEAEDAIPEDKAEDVPSETRKSVVDFFPGIEDDGMQIEDSAVEDFISSVRLGEDEESVSGNYIPTDKEKELLAKMRDINYLLRGKYSIHHAHDSFMARKDTPCLLNLYDSNSGVYEGEKIFYKENWLVQSVSAAQLPNYYYAFLNRTLENASDYYKTADAYSFFYSYDGFLYEKKVRDNADSVCEKYKNLEYFTRPEIRVYKTNIPYIYRVRITAAKGHYILAWGVNGYWGKNTKSNTPSLSNAYNGAWDGDYGLNGDRYACVEFNAYMPNTDKETDKMLCEYAISAFDDTSGYSAPYRDQNNIAFFNQYETMWQNGSVMVFHPEQEIPESEFNDYKEKYKKEIASINYKYTWYYPLRNTEENRSELLKTFSEDDLDKGHQEYLASKGGPQVDYENRIFFVTKKPKGYKVASKDVYYNTETKKVAYKVKKALFTENNYFSGLRYDVKKGALGKDGYLTFTVKGPAPEKLEVYSKKGMGTIKLEKGSYEEFIPAASGFDKNDGNMYKLWTSTYSYKPDSYEKGTDIIYYKVPYTDSKGRTKYKKYSFRVTIK